MLPNAATRCYPKHRRYGVTTARIITREHPCQSSNHSLQHLVRIGYVGSDFASHMIVNRLCRFSDMQHTSTAMLCLCSGLTHVGIGARMLHIAQQCPTRIGRTCKPAPVQIQHIGHIAGPTKPNGLLYHPVSLMFRPRPSVSCP